MVVRPLDAWGPVLGPQIVDAHGVGVVLALEGGLSAHRAGVSDAALCVHVTQVGGGTGEFAGDEGEDPVVEVVVHELVFHHRLVSVCRSPRLRSGLALSLSKGFVEGLCRRESATSISASR